MVWKGGEKCYGCEGEEIWLRGHQLVRDAAIYGSRWMPNHLMICHQPNSTREKAGNHTGDLPAISAAISARSWDPLAPSPTTYWCDKFIVAVISSWYCPKYQAMNEDGEKNEMNTLCIHGWIVHVSTKHTCHRTPLSHPLQNSGVPTEHQKFPSFRPTICQQRQRL